MSFLRNIGSYTVAFIKWCTLAVLVGCLGGSLGAGFHHTLHWVTNLRGQLPWLVWLLPVGGIVSVGIYRLCRMPNNRGTNEIIDAVHQEKPVNPLIAPVIFIATSITHLFGGSAGREGAALQLGGSVASSLGKLLKWNGQPLRILTMCGMSAVFAGLFGTPLTACIFILEFTTVGTFYIPGLLPCFVSSYCAGKIAGLLGVHAEGLILGEAVFPLATFWKYVILAMLVALLGIAMCYLFHKTEHLAHKWLCNPFVRIAVSGLLIAVLTALVGDHRFNGAGMDMALSAVEGDFHWYHFLLKLLF